MRLLPWLAAVAVGLCFGPALTLADDPPKKPDPPRKTVAEPKTPAEKLAAIADAEAAATKAVLSAQQAMRKQTKTETDEQKKVKQEAFDKAVAEYRKASAEAGRRYIALAKEFPADPAALDALATALQPNYGIVLSDDLIAIVRKHHLNSPKLAGLLSAVARNQSPGAGNLLKAIAAEATDAKVKGMATFAAVNYGLERLTGYTSQATKADYAKLRPELERQIDQIATEFADVVFNGVKLSAGIDPLRERLKKADSLLIGTAAPEIAAADIDGKEFKLSDYRGKVVMLDFWGDW
jgi:AhpC/TSA family